MNKIKPVKNSMENLDKCWQSFPCIVSIHSINKNRLDMKIEYTNADVTRQLCESCKASKTPETKETQLLR